MKEPFGYTQRVRCIFECLIIFIQRDCLMGHVSMSSFMGPTVNYLKWRHQTASSKKACDITTCVHMRFFFQQEDKRCCIFIITFLFHLDPLCFFLFLQTILGVSLTKKHMNATRDIISSNQLIQQCYKKIPHQTPITRRVALWVQLYRTIKHIATEMVQADGTYIWTLSFS